MSHKYRQTTIHIHTHTHTHTHTYTEGTVVTMVSRPRVRSMRKKMIAQKGDRGSLVRASGYTTNAMPGPETHTHTHI